MNLASTQVQPSFDDRSRMRHASRRIGKIGRPTQARALPSKLDVNNAASAVLHRIKNEENPDRLDAGIPGSRKREQARSHSRSVLYAALKSKRPWISAQLCLRKIDLRRAIAVEPMSVGRRKDPRWVLHTKFLGGLVGPVRVIEKRPRQHDEIDRAVTHQPIRLLWCADVP
jgi:hypothetical protein